jgi:uncharacterized cupredoxin-like copper-binding protein
MRLRSRIKVAALWVGAAVAVGACGGDGEQARTTPATQPPTQTATTPATGGTAATVTIRETEWKLTPTTPTVQQGTVRFRAVNAGDVVHALEIEGPSGEVETRELQPGESQSISVNLDRAGRYVIYCPVGNHRELGMEGAVIVR